MIERFNLFAIAKKVNDTNTLNPPLNNDYTEFLEFYADNEETFTNRILRTLELKLKDFNPKEDKEYQFIALKNIKERYFEITISFKVNKETYGRIDWRLLKVNECETIDEFLDLINKHKRIGE